MEHICVHWYSIFSMPMCRRILYVGELEMTQYSEVVEYQKDLLEAEEWSKQVAAIHSHCFNSMWYDDRPQDTANRAGVTDIEFNDGTIKRLQKGIHIHTFGTPLTGAALVDNWRKKK